MAFDPDEYLNETGTSSTATAEFDPDAYLSETEEQEATFDPDAYLAEEATPLAGLAIPPAPEVPKFEARKPEEGMLRKAADVPVRFLAGTTGVLKSFADVFGADSPASQQFEERQRFWNNLVSESGKEKDKRAAEIQRAAEDKGAWEQAKAAGRAFLESPTSMLATGAGSLAPFIATSAIGTVARGGAAAVKGAQLVAGTLAGVGEVKGRIYEEVKQAALDAGKTPEEAEAMASEAQSYGENPEQIIAGGALGALASVTGIEATAGRAIAGAARKAATGAQIVGKNVAQEVATEVPQQAQSAIAKNIALQKAGFNVPTFQGVAGEATTAGIVAAALGGVAGGIDAVAASSENAQKVKMAVNTQSAAQQVTDVAPLTATVVMDQAEETGRQAAADLQTEADQRITELTKTPEQRVARLQREAQEAAGDIELEEEPPVSGLPPVEPTPPVTPTPEAVVAPVEPVVPAEGAVEPAVTEVAPEAAVELTPVVPPPVTPQLESLRRVARAEQTEEDVAGLVDSGFVEVYNGQPVLTQAGLDALPEAERPRLTPEARKIQIDTRTSEAAAEAISKNLRIGVDQVPPDVRMPAGWTLEGDVYVPPQPQVVAPAPTPEVREARREPAITPQQDRDYLDAVERGDLDAASRVVEDAAKVAGNRTTAYRSNTQTVTVFDTRDRAAWFTDDLTDAQDYAELTDVNPETVSKYFLNTDNFASLDDPKIARQIRDIVPNINDLMAVSDAMAQIRQRLGDRYDGIKVTSFSMGYETTHYNPFNPEQIKSAEPVTRDDQGNIIPLSQRFQPEQADIRYARREPAVPRERFYSQLQRTVEAKMPNVSSPEQLKAIIDPARGSGVKPEEVKWSGITEAIDRIAAENNGRVPKEAVLKYLLDEGAVKFEEVTLARKKVPYTGGKITRMADGNYMVSFLGYSRVYTKLEDAESDLQKMREGASRTDDETKYSQYQLPEGENYREVVLTIPTESAEELSQKMRDLSRERRGIQESGRMLTREESNRITEIDEETRSLEEKIESAKSKYKSPHFANIPNYVAHMRLNDRKDSDGKNGTFIEEIQSDLHQKAREVGYKDQNIVRQNFVSWLKSNKKELSEQEIQTQFRTQIGEEIQQWLKDQEIAARNDSAVPDAPFRKDWPIQMFKRALEQAVMSGKDWIGWTTGETQAARYDLSKNISEVAYNVDSESLFAYDKDGNNVLFESNVTYDKIADYIGKEAAERLSSSKIEIDRGGAMQRLKGEDLKVGGEGMAGFYDNILPKEIAKYVKKWGATVEKSKLDDPDEAMTYEGLAAEGLTMREYNALPRDEAEALRKKYTTGTPIWRVNITPEMRQIIQEEGQAVFLRRLRGEPMAGMEQAAVEARLQELGFPTGGIIRVVNQPDADFEGRTIILDGKVTGIELNASALKDNAAIDRVLNHEFAESANADGALNNLVERLTPKEKKEINDTITRLRYEERARTSEEAARAIETLAEAWKGRGFFTRAVARVEAWASKLGFKLTRRAAEYIAARNLADINAGFRTAYNQTINRVSGDEARYSYAGTLAVTPRFMRDSLKAAQSMAAAGKTNEEIRLTTGWFKGKYDNKLRWEIPDYKSFIKKDATKKLKEGGDVRLEDVLDHPELYAAYPDAKRIKVYLITKDEGASYAANTIGINPFSKFEGFNFRNAMLHEIQHWIQDKEGFASGTSPERFAHSMSRLKEDLKEAEEGLRDIKREWYDSDEQYQKERESWAWEVDLYKKIIRAKERGLGAYQIYQLAAGEIEANDVERRNSMDEEARKRYEPYAFSNVSPEDAIAMDVRGAMPTSMEMRESRREPEAIPTFTEGTPEAATLKEMEASMAKVDAASEAKGGKPETYKISEIASVWMDSGLGERELQDAITEYTNLTPANAARVAKAIARQYDIQQSIATAFLETQTGLSVEALPEGVALPKEVDPDRPKPVMQRLFEVFMGVRVPPTKITVNEKTALKQQIRLKAAANRAAKAAQKETSDQVIEVIKAMDLRGGVRPKQVQALAKRAAKVIWTNEKSLETFADYAAKVVENANYDADLREAKAAQARAKQLSKQKKVAMGPQREMLDNISKIAINRLDDPRMYADVVNYYLRGFKAVLSPDYVVVPDSEMTSYLSQMQSEATRNQRDLDRAVNERLAEKYGVDIDDLNSVLEAADIISQLEANENREAMDNLLTEKAIETRDGLKAYDQTPLRADQRKLVDAIMKVDPKALDAEERQRFIRITNNIIYNNQTNGAEYFASVAKGQQSARAAAQDSDMIAKNKAWINLLPRLVSERMQRGWALELQSVADTFRNAFGKGAMAKVYKAMGMLDLNMGFTKANNTIDEIQEKIAEFHTKLEKKYKAAARNQDGLLAEGVAGFLIQKVPNKGETESIAQRRDLIKQDIANRRGSGEVDRMAMADRIETILNQIDGEGVQAVLNKLKQTYPANHESLVWYKDTLLPQYKDFLKNFDENFNDQANNYDNPDYLPIAFSKASPSLAITPEEEQVFFDQVSLTPKQSAYTIKRVDYTTLPTDRTTKRPKEIEFNLRRNAFDSLSDQINKAYTSSAWQQLASFMKTPESEVVFGGQANKDFFIERLNRLRLSRMRRGSMSRGNIERAVDSLSVISRKLGTGIALGGVYQWIKQPPDQLVTALGSGGRYDLMAQNIMPKNQKAARELLRKFSIGRRGDASSGYKYINQMEGHQNRLERYFSESKWDQVKEEGSKVADVWMAALKQSDFWAASTAWMTYYEGELNKRNIKIEDWAKEAELVDTDPARQEAAAFAEQMTDIYQGSSDPTQMATFAQSGKSGWENLMKAIFVPFNSFAIQQRMRLYSDARDVLNGEKSGVGGLTGTIGGLLLFHATKRLVLPVISGSVAGILYTLLGVDMEEPDEEKQKEEANKRWRQMQGEMLGNLLVGGTPQIVEAKFIDAMNYASYLISLQLESESVLNDDGEVMSFDQYAKERSPFWRYRSFDNAMSLGMLDIGLGQAEQAILQTKMVATPEEMEMYTPEEQRLLYFSALSEWLYLMRLNDADFARIVSKARRDMVSAAKEREKELKRIREGR